MYLALSNGITVITLNNDGGAVGAGLFGARYFPTDSGEDTVTETINQVFSGTVTQVRAIMASITKLLREATERTAGNLRIPTLYLLHNPAGGSVGAYRSEVKGGRLEWSTNRDLRQLSGITDTAGEAGIFIERANFFEDQTEVTLVNAVAILNGNNSPRNQVSCSTSTGDLPSPIRVEIKNTSGVDVIAENIYLNMDSFVVLLGGQHLLAGDTATWVAAIPDNTLILECPIPDAVLVKCAGEEMNIIAAFSAVPSNLYLRAALYTVRDGLYLQGIRGKEVYTGGKELINLGSIPIPASGYATGSSSVILGIVARCATAGSATLEFTQIMPAANMIDLYYNDYDMVNNGIFKDDGDSAYYEEAGAKFDTVYRNGGPLQVWPNRPNSLSVLVAEDASFVETRQFEISVFHRPRRRTV